MNFLVNPMYQIGKSGMLQSMGSQRVRYDLVAEQQQMYKSVAMKQLSKHNGFKPHLS